MPETSPTPALILAGGLGTRLRSVVADVPKPMADVGGEPFLAHQLRYWGGQGVRHFILSVGYKAEIVERYFGNAWEGARISYVHETEPLGTGGAVRHALAHFPALPPNLLLLNGDTWFEASLAQLRRDAQTHHAPVTLTLKTIENTGRYGGVTCDAAGKVLTFNPAGHGKTLINTGCYLLNAPVLAIVMRDYPERFSWEEAVLAPLAAAGKVAASIQEARFLDIGIPEDYARAATFLKGNA